MSAFGSGSVQVAYKKSKRSSKWEPWKDIIKDKYVSQGKTLKEVMEVMEEECGFFASKPEYERQLKCWGFRKNSTPAEWKFIRRRLEQRQTRGLKSTVYIHGQLIPAKKLRKETGRVFISALEALEKSRVPTPEGVVILSPMPECYVACTRNNELPWKQFCRAIDTQARHLVFIEMPVFRRQVTIPYLLPARYDDCAVATRKILDYMSAVMPLSLCEEIFDLLKVIFDPFSRDSTLEFIKLVVYVLSNNLVNVFGRPYLIHLISEQVVRWFQLGENGGVLKQMLAVMTPTIHAVSEVFLSATIRLQDFSLSRVLLEAGVDPNVRLHNEHEIEPPSNLLAYAVRNENMDLFKLLLSHGAVLNWPWPRPAFRERNALHLAAQGGNLDVVRHLLDTFGKRHCIMEHGSFCLALAIENGQHHVSRYLIQHGAHLQSTTFHHSPLQAAAKAMDVEMASYLLLNGADANDPAPFGGRSALQWAATTGSVEMLQLLVASGVDVNGAPATWEGETALVAAVLQGDIEMVQRLIALGADVNDRTGRRTSLEAAALSGHLDIVQLLLAAGADASKDSCLAAAVRSGNKEFLVILLGAGADINHTSRHQSVLAEAARLDDLSLVRLLLELGADPNADCCGEKELAFEYNGTALQYATGLRDFEVIKVLMNAGADPNRGTLPSWGLNPLQMAARNGDMDLLSFFISEGGDVNHPELDDCGRTALQAAVENGHANAFRWLLEQGADVNASASRINGVTALQAAVRRNDYQLVRLLLETGANVDGPPSECMGRTALQEAAWQGNIHIATALIEAGADVNVAGARLRGYTALQAAAAEGHFHMVEFLLSKGALVNAELSCEERPALQAAAVRGYLRIAQLLIDAGADVDARRTGGESMCPNTAMEAAACNGRMDMIRLLLNAGAKITGAGRTQFDRAIEFARRGGHHAVAEFLRHQQIA